MCIVDLPAIHSSISHPADKVALDPSGKSRAHRIIANNIRPAPKPAAGFLIGEAFVAKAVCFAETCPPHFHQI
jgi:hypothetical protein